MKVKSKSDGKIYEAIKTSVGYTVEDKDYTKEQMRDLFIAIKEKKEEVKVETVVASSNETMSEDISNISKALVKAIGQMSNGAKNKEGYNYKYLTLDSLVDLVRPILAKNGLAIMQTHQLIGTNVATHTTVLHESGEWFKSTLEIPLSSSKSLSAPQQIGICCTYARRYVIQALFMIAAEDDNDGVIK